MRIFHSIPLTRLWMFQGFRGESCWPVGGFFKLSMDLAKVAGTPQGLLVGGMGDSLVFLPLVMHHGLPSPAKLNDVTRDHPGESSVLGPGTRLLKTLPFHCDTEVWGNQVPPTAPQPTSPLPCPTHQQSLRAASPPTPTSFLASAPLWPPFLLLRPGLSPDFPNQWVLSPLWPYLFVIQSAVLGSGLQGGPVLGLLQGVPHSPPLPPRDPRPPPPSLVFWSVWDYGDDPQKEMRGRGEEGPSPGVYADWPDPNRALREALSTQLFPGSGHCPRPRRTLPALTSPRGCPAPCPCQGHMHSPEHVGAFASVVSPPLAPLD